MVMFDLLGVIKGDIAVPTVNCEQGFRGEVAFLPFISLEIVIPNFGGCSQEIS